MQTSAISLNRHTNAVWVVRCVCVCIYVCRYVCIYTYIYRAIHKSLRDFRPLRYSSRDGHAEGEHVNKGRDTPGFCPTLQVLDMSTLGDAADVNPAKFQDMALLILCPRHVSLRLSPSVIKKNPQLGEILYLLICSFLLCLSWMLRSWVRKFRRDLWITLYM